jgi:NAD(P)-dependent dehydrogenase (short-subunit alcohol dehydrogenase family)
MDLQLEGKTALVTGSSAGIGFASAVALAQEGASVVVNGRDAGRLADAERRLLSLVPAASVRSSAADVCAGHLHSAVTKAALFALSRGLADLTRGTAVTVNTVLAGPTATEGVGTLIKGVASQTGMSREQIVDHLFATDQAGSLLQRLARPEEVASLIAYLASPLASVTNGAVVRAEGGTVSTIL